MKKIRLWQLKPDFGPIKLSEIKKLSKLIENKLGDEKDVINIVWGPELEIKEFYFGEKDE